MAIRNGTILETGTKEAVSRYIGNTTKVIDLAGRTLTPGLIDSHGHLPYFGARERNMVKLQGLETKEEVLERFAERAKKTPPGRFISGWGIESNELSFMNRRDLDRHCWPWSAAGSSTKETRQADNNPFACKAYS